MAEANTWNKGIMHRMVSFSFNVGKAASRWLMLTDNWPWVMLTPLGRLVVPPVY